MKPNFEELRFIAELLRTKHREWSQLPELDTPHERLNNPVMRHFCMSIWRRDIEHDCGFAGCAIGTYLTFAAERAKEKTGLQFTSSGDWQYPILENESDSILAVATAFGISIKDANYLFNSQMYTYEQGHDPLFVASRIDYFCDGLVKW